MKYISIFLIALISSIASAQPNTEVYLFDLKNENGTVSIDNPINISNNKGYDNQPSFWPGGKSALYARTINGQTEIAHYFIKSSSTKIITDTKQGSEYSPTPMPDGKRISSIRLDTTGLQLLYAYDLEGRGEVLVKDLVIGYHAWINNSEIVAFVLGEPSTMQIINTKSGEARIVSENIGRSLHKIPKSANFSFVDKSSVPWVIKSMNPKKEKIKIIAATLEQSEDYAWLSQNQIITGHGSILYQLNVIHRQWNQIIDLGPFGLKEITRLAVSPDRKKLLVVTE